MSRLKRKILKAERRVRLMKHRLEQVRYDRDEYLAYLGNVSKMPNELRWWWDDKPHQVMCRLVRIAGHVIGSGNEDAAAALLRQHFPEGQTLPGGDPVIPEPIEQAITEMVTQVRYPGVTMQGPQRYEQAKAALVAAIEAEIEKRDAWRQAVDDQLVLIYAPFVDDPKEALHRIISWHSDVAVDPAVSADARALIRRGAEAMQQRVVENCRNMAKAYATSKGQPTASEAATFLADAFEAFDPEAPSDPV
jgi:hypothetical protein